jgi:hypothetical protein
VYLVTADSPELLDLGIRAFVAAAKNDNASFPPSDDLAALGGDDPRGWPGFSLYTPSLSAIPKAEAVAGLGQVPDITSNEQVGAIIGAMPQQLLGQSRFIPLFGPNSPTVYNATYGHRYGP